MENRKNTLQIDSKQLAIVSLLVLIFMIAVPMLLINLSKTDIPKASSDTITTENNPITIKGDSVVKVYIANEKKVKEVPLEDYIVSVVSSEMPANFDLEALKAQAVAARTFLAKRKENHCPQANGADICDTVHCQVYMSKEDRMAKWDDSSRNSNWDKIESAVKATEGQVLSYDNKLVENPQFFSTSSGKTEDAADVFSSSIPYLVSTESLGEDIAPKYISSINVSKVNFVETFNKAYPSSTLTIDNIENNIIIINRSEAGGIKELKIGNITIKGTDFRMLFKLNSTNFEYKLTGEDIFFNCKGYGHGVGMSQWGANVMGKSGTGYEDILKHYYKGIDIRKLVFE